MNDPREAKLPKWVQVELAHLRAEIESSKNAIADLSRNPPSDTNAKDYTHPERSQSLGDGRQIEFTLKSTPRKGTVEVHTSDSPSLGKILVVRGSDQINVLPSFGNSVYIQLRD